MVGIHGAADDELLQEYRALLLQPADGDEEDVDVSDLVEKHSLSKEAAADMQKLLKQKVQDADRLVSPRLNSPLMAQVAALYNVSYKSPKDYKASGGTLAWRIAYDLLCQLKVMLKVQQSNAQSADGGECALTVDPEVFAALIAPKQRNAPVSDSQDFCME